MDECTSKFAAHRGRIRRALMFVGATVLFLAGLLLLLAPASAQDSECRTQSLHFHGGANGWIIGAQSHEPTFLAGG